MLKAGAANLLLSTDSHLGDTPQVIDSFGNRIRFNEELKTDKAT